MNSSIHNLPGVFRELSRLSDGDHTIYLRTDSHNFFEIHRTGIRNLFTSTVAAFIPNVVIKLQTPLVSSIIAAVPSRQGAPTLHTRSGLFIVEALSDIVNFVKHHKAAFIREDATLAVWADEVQPALAAFHQVLKELGIALDRHDLVRVVDPSSNSLPDSNADGDAFDEFIHNYDDPTDKPHDESPFLQAGHNALLSLRSLDDADTLEAMYTVSRANLFDTLSSDSLVLGDSPFLSSAVSKHMSRLCLDSTPQACLSPTFSSLSFDFSSPSVSSDSSSDYSTLSTPLTIAPSVLSSPHSTWNSPQLPTISESSLEEAFQDALPVDSVDPTRATPSGSEEELSAGNASKRKRSPKAQKARPAEEVAPEKPRSRRTSRVPISPEVAAPPSPRARKAVSKAIAPSPPASPRAMCPLPGRRTRSSSTSSTSSACLKPSPSRPSMMSALKTKRSRAPAAQLTISRVTRAAYSESEPEPEPEILESDDSGSEYEADPSELELDELDDDEDDDCDDYYRPAKRTRSLPSSPRATSPGPAVTTAPVPVRRKAVSPKLASEKKKGSKKKKSSGWSAGGSGKKKKAKAKAQPEGPPPMCVWCDKEFTRESDVLRHELHSCKLYPFERKLWCCPLCDKVISRTDAVIRHQGSDDCKKRQRELRDQGLLTTDKVARKKAGARAAKAAKAPLSPRRRPSRAVSL